MSRERSERRTKVHKTQTGRVVYNRKPHIMTIKDAVRVAKNVIMEPGVEFTPLTWLSASSRFREFLVSLIYELFVAYGFAILGSISYIFKTSLGEYLYEDKSKED